MNDFTHLKMTIDYWYARWTVARRDETGSAAEYMVLLIGLVAVAALVVLAVKTFVTNKGKELNSGG